MEIMNKTEEIDEKNANHHDHHGLDRSEILESIFDIAENELHR